MPRALVAAALVFTGCAAAPALMRRPHFAPDSHNETRVYTWPCMGGCIHGPCAHARPERCMLFPKQNRLAVRVVGYGVCPTITVTWPDSTRSINSGDCAPGVEERFSRPFANHRLADFHTGEIVVEIEGGPTLRVDVSPMPSLEEQTGGLK